MLHLKAHDLLCRHQPGDLAATATGGCAEALERLSGTRIVTNIETGGDGSRPAASG